MTHPIGRGLAILRDAIARVQTYIGAANTILLIGLVAPALRESSTVNWLVDRVTHHTFTEIPELYFVGGIYVVGLLGVGILYAVDYYHVRSAEAGWGNNFHPFSENIPMQAAWFVAELERRGVEVGDVVERYRRDAELMGFSKEFERYLEGFRKPVQEAPRRDVVVEEEPELQRLPPR